MFGLLKVFCLIIFLTISLDGQNYDKVFILSQASLVRGDIIEYFLTNNLNECLIKCKNNINCYGINFAHSMNQDTVCILMSKEGNVKGNDDYLPVESSVIYSGVSYFTKHLNESSKCDNMGWRYKKINNFDVRRKSLILQAESTFSLEDCLNLCDNNFLCLSVSYNSISFMCKLLTINFQTVEMSKNSFITNDDWTIYEKNCPKKNNQKKSCIFQQYHNTWIGEKFIVKLLNIESVTSCEKHCLSTKSFECHSYSYDKKNKYCYLSDQLIKTINENIVKSPSNDIISGEMTNCINFNLQCTSNGVIINYESSQLFTGNISLQNSTYRKMRECNRKIEEKYYFSTFYSYNNCGFVKNVNNNGLEYKNKFIVKEGLTNFITIRDKLLSIQCTFKDTLFKNINNDISVGTELVIDDKNNSDVKKIKLPQSVRQIFILSIQNLDGNIIDDFKNYDNISIVIEGEEPFEVKDLKIKQLNGSDVIPISDEFGNIIYDKGQIKVTSWNKNDKYKLMYTIYNINLSNFNFNNEIVVEGLILKCNDKKCKNFRLRRNSIEMTSSMISQRNINLEQEIYYIRNNGKIFMLKSILNQTTTIQPSVPSAVLYQKTINIIYLLFALFTFLFIITGCLILKIWKYGRNIFFMYQRQVDDKDKELEGEDVNK
uniref:Apple domain-containing protein n=1 Tax=Parastrongyloides trichosuri TaxID=131310 RepID=A0A0N4Z938_PARTI